MKRQGLSRWAIPVLGLTLGLNLAMGAQAQASVPAGTRLDPIQIGKTKITLPPKEQVAFLFIYNLVELEGQCRNPFFGGPGRWCTLRELLAGLKTSSGVLGLTRNPAADPFYRFRLEFIGKDLVIKALPKQPGLAAFAFVGPADMGGNYYYSPNGARLAQAQHIDGMGYAGKGFKR